MYKLAILLLAAVAVQAKFIPEVQDAAVLWPAIMKAGQGRVNAMGRNLPFDGKVVNGSDATLGQFPHQCRMNINTLTGSYLCGCSVIATDWILTAAHCVDITGVRTIDIVMGDILRNTVEPGEVTARAISWTQHENWAPNIIRNDVAVIRIPSVTFTNNIDRICLATTATDAPERSTVTISGWGKTSDTSVTPDHLQWVDLSVIPNAECLAFYGSLSVHDGNICTSTSEYKGTCNGDSGGPLIYQSSQGKVEVGIVSYGASASCANPDNRAGPSAFTRVSFYHQWIVANAPGAALC